jgi:hypothetical protein
MTRRRRPWIALGLAAAALLLGGCVYLRLLELKRQLGRFDQYFSLRTDDGLGIVCHKPVVRTGDICWIGAKPETVRKLGLAEHWHLRMVKQLPPGVTEPARYDVLLEMSFADDKLTRVTIPEQYFAAIPKAFVIGVIRSFGRGEIDQAQKKIEATVGAPELAASRPRLESIDRLLGKPSETRVEGTMTVMRYRFVPATTEPDPGEFDMTLHFDTATGQLRRWHSRTPVGGIGFKFAADPKTK